MPQLPELFDLAGVLHVHTLYSDGTGTVPEIASAAQANGLDFVLVTDHDSLEAKQRGEEGWYGSVLVLVGVEVSPYRKNHYLAFGLDQPVEHRGLEPAEIVAAVNDAGGFGFLSHPFSTGSPRFRRRAGGMSWRDLECEGYTGVELWSFVTDGAEQIVSIADIFRFVLAPGRFIDHPPARNLETWDRLCAARRCVGLGGIDAHQVGVRIGNRVPLRLMAYKRSFRYLRTHLLADHALTGSLEADRETIYAALQAGRAYIAMDALAPGKGFRFWAEGDSEPLLMGDEAPAGAARVLRVSLPRAARVRLLCDGGELASQAEATALEWRIDDPGVYRVEAYLERNGRERTWILSNPIYLR